MQTFTAFTEQICFFALRCWGFPDVKEAFAGGWCGSIHSSYHRKAAFWPHQIATSTAPAFERSVVLRVCVCVIICIYIYIVIIVIIITIIIIIMVSIDVYLFICLQ